ncbi:MAG: hypothetical protein ACR2KZ_20910 [Segetibacter sp.]
MKCPLFCSAVGGIVKAEDPFGGIKENVIGREGTNKNTGIPRNEIRVLRRLKRVLKLTTITAWIRERLSVFASLHVFTV